MKLRYIRQFLYILKFSFLEIKRTPNVQNPKMLIKIKNDPTKKQEKKCMIQLSLKFLFKWENYTI